MSTKKTIAKSFTVSTIEDGVSVQAQYAPNANPTSGQIHTVWQEGDLYMRTRESDESAWSSWHKIVGESGDETDFRFAISSQKTTANASTSPSDIGTNDWGDTPVAITSDKPYLWARVQQKSWNASTQSYVVDSTRYIRLTGEEGKGYKAIVYRNNFTLGEWNTYGEIGHMESWENTESSRNGCGVGDLFLVVGRATDDSSYHKLTYRCDNSSGSLHGTCIEHQVTNDGNRGKTGRFYYYAQEWTNSSSPLYIVTDAQAPYFLYNNNYWVFNPEENYPNGISMSAMGTPSSNNSKWQLMTNDFKYIITQAIFGKYAHFGSAIINEDWLISTHGTIDGTAYGGSADNPDKYQGQPAYTYFDPNGFPYINRNQWTIGGSESTCEHAGFELTLTRGRSYTFKITGSIASGSWTMSVSLKNVATGNIISLTSFNSTTQTTKTVTVTISSGATGSSVWRLYQSRSGGSSNGYVTRFESNGSHSFVPNYAIDLRTGASYQFRAHIRGTIYAEAGEIGGFAIDDDSLYNTNYQAGIDIRDAASNPKRQVQIGSNSIDDYTHQECAIVVRDKKTPQSALDGNKYNTGMYFDVSNATFNFAFHGLGNGVLNGLVYGFKVQEFNIYSKTSNHNADSYLHIGLEDGGLIAITGTHNSGNVYIYMPTHIDVASCLGINTSTAFFIEINVLCLSNYGSIHLVWDGRGDAPTLYDFDNSPQGTFWNQLVAVGDYWKIALMYFGGVYRSFITRHIDSGWG